MGESPGNWCLIESDPGVFSELIREFGVKGLQVEELWSLEKDDFDRIKPIHGLVFLYKWNAGSVTTASVVQDSRLDTIFFAKQVIQNACATQALISILLNCPGVELGPTLSEFREFAMAMDPAMKGLALSNSERIREVHNSFARQSLFELDPKLAEKDDDVFHFVSYIPVNGRLYELDGLQEGPLDHGAVDGDWLDVAREIIQKRIKEFKGDEIHFNLMAIVEDKKLAYGQQKDAIQVELAERPDMPESERNEKLAELSRLEGLLHEEEEKRKRWLIENARRKHNYVPFIVELLRLLGKQGMLMPLYNKAKERVLKRASASKASDKSKSDEPVKEKSSKVNEGN